MIAIPFNPSKSADQEITFTGVGTPVKLRFTWNVFSESWFISFGECAPRRAIVGFPILKSMKYLLPVRGDFMLKRMATTTPASVGYEDLGKLWFLCYLTETEVETWGVRNGLE